MSFKMIYLSVLPSEVQTAVVNTSDADTPCYQTGLFAILKLRVYFEMHYSMGQHR